MIAFFLLASMAGAQSGAAEPPLCLPVASKPAHVAPSAIADHRMLRAAIGEPMPEASTMIMLFGRGGHLATEEHSIVLARDGDRLWHGTAVGRIRIGQEPFRPLQRTEWTLDKAAGRQLDRAMARRCSPERKPAAGAASSGPPPRGYIPGIVDVVVREGSSSTFYAGEDDDRIVALLQPKR
jgi:hypothetical protein